MQKYYVMDLKELNENLIEAQWDQFTRIQKVKKTATKTPPKSWVLNSTWTFSSNFSYEAEGLITVYKEGQSLFILSFFILFQGEASFFPLKIRK